MLLGPGPVFWIELVALARRWQTYALRVALLSLLLLVLFLVYINDVRLATGRPLKLNDHAELGQRFAFVVLTTQLAVILLASAGATAGAICLDKSRGNLTLLLATDLRSFEIVLGKLLARLLPVLGLIAASLPVFAIATLLGGISGEFLYGGFVVLAGAAVFAAAVAFFFSVWVGRTHEALLLTYFVLFLWLIGVPALRLFTTIGAAAWSEWMRLNPFGLLYMPLRNTIPVEVEDYLLYLLFTLGASVVLIAVATWRLRSVVLAQTGRPVRRRRFWWPTPRGRAMWLLDRYPLRWYERFRKRPSRAGRIITLLYLAFALCAAAWSILIMVTAFPGHQIALFANLTLLGFGLLLTTVAAVTSLADERTRGSLDILLTTPLSTRAIVNAKWRAAFRPALWLLPLPLLIGVVLGFVGHRDGGVLPAVIAMVMLVVHPLASAALFVSLGLFLATRLQQFGRAVGIAVTIYIVLAVGWPLLIIATMHEDWVWGVLLMVSPAFGPGLLTAVISYAPRDAVGWAILFGGLAWSVLDVLVAMAIYERTVRIFNLRMGRISQQKE